MAYARDGPFPNRTRLFPFNHDVGHVRRSPDQPSSHCPMSTNADLIGLATADLMANITNEIHDLSPRPVCFGGYSDIYTGVWRSESGEMKARHYAALLSAQPDPVV
ncbi:hypothetical protein EXIGLDRAFT_762177 [Exidia glandulosa HHB12029]|uniref:Uncharacterized protein n=1 Tax=Exidia glandulosa HHB12029 TaxID=1314781 RepID=A0A165MWT8_EXIGL|nr:hypothetical protein EXIGLDRAFT_762177 [Exidia glandulosa HHB12029]